MKKNSVCFILFNTKKSGGLQVVINHATYLAESGHPVSLCFLFGKKIEDSDSYPFSLESIWSIFRQRDIVVATFWPTAFLLPILKARRKIYFVQGWEPLFYSNFILRFFCRLTYKLSVEYIAVSHFLFKKIRLQNKDAPITLIPNGVDPIFYKESGETRKKKCIQRKKPVILSIVSSYAPHKGIAELLWLVGRLKQTHPEWIFEIISFEDHSPSPLFTSFIKNPSKKELVQRFREATVYVSTSRVEGFHLPILEAMATGCPVVTTDSGGIQDFCRDNINSFVRENVKAILNDWCIEKLIHSKKLFHSFRDQGMKTANSFRLSRSLQIMETYLS